MRSHNCLILIASLLSSVAHAAGRPKTSLFQVLIDPGHGGRDSGALRDGLRESQLTLQISKAAKAAIVRQPGFSAGLTRESDQTLSLEDRLELISASGADVVLSLHINSSTDPKAEGCEIYFQNQLPADEESLVVAARENSAEAHQELVPATDAKSIGGREVPWILSDLTQFIRIVRSSRLAAALLEVRRAQAKASSVPLKSSIRQAPFRLVSESAVPTVLIELGFISNPRERARLESRDYQEQLADGIARALVQYRKEAREISIDRLSANH